MTTETYAIFDRANYDSLTDAMADGAVIFHSSEATRGQLSALLGDLPSVCSWAVEELPPKYVTIQAKTTEQERLLAAVVAATEHPKTPRTGLGFATVNCSPSLQKWISIEGLAATYHIDESTIEAAERELIKGELQLSRVIAVEEDHQTREVTVTLGEGRQLSSALTSEGKISLSNENNKIGEGRHGSRNQWYLSRYDNRENGIADILGLIVAAMAANALGTLGK